MCMSKKRYCISVTDWSNNVDVDGYYTYNISLNPELDPGFQPNIFVTGVNDNTFATAAQKAAFKLIKDDVLNDFDNIILYAKEKPEIDFYVFVEGKEYDSSIINLYFNPITHTATEEDFIAFLNLGIYTRKIIGYKVIISNESSQNNYNGGTWVIADVAHDSLNQPKSYDLIAEEAFANIQIETADTGNKWRSCSLRTWLNGAYYNGFSSALKSYMLHICYPSFNGSSVNTYNDDYVILPSAAEVGLFDEDVTEEGTKYPIFTDDASRVRYTFGTTDANRWWTRSRDTETDGIIWAALEDGSFYHGGCNFVYNATAVMRVS